MIMDISMIVGIVLAVIFVVPFVWISVRSSKNHQDKNEENE